MTPERLKEIEERLGLGWGWDWYSDAADDLLAEVKRLRGEVEGLRICLNAEATEVSRLREANALSGELAETLDAANAEIARLRGALEPFAECEKLLPWVHPDFTRAAAALAPTPHQAGEEAGEGECGG